MSSELVNYLKQMAEMQESCGHIDLMKRFVLRNGKEFRAVPFDGERMTPKECFTNATHYAQMHGLEYAEGFVIGKGIPIAIHHAWCVDKDGNAVDPTLKDPEDWQYFGIQVPIKEAIKDMLRTGYYGLLAPDEMYNIAFMQKKDKKVKEDLKLAKKVKPKFSTSM